MKAKSELRAKFAELLHQQLRANGMSQCALATKLGVSPAAVCQILKGVSIPRPGHLQAICEILQIQPQAASELRSLCSDIRSGLSGSQSALNKMLTTYREAKGLSLDRLSRLTGISIDELKMLETCASAFPTASQCFTLAEKLGCKPEDIMLASGTSELIEEGYKEYAKENSISAFSVAEPPAAYEPQANDNGEPHIVIPEIHINLMPTVYTIDSREIIHRNAANFVRDDSVPDDCIVINGPARSFDITGKGFVRLVIRREPPTTKQFALFYDKDESRWRLGVMRPYRVFAAFDGKEIKCKNPAYLWSVVKMTVNMEVVQ